MIYLSLFTVCFISFVTIVYNGFKLHQIEIFNNDNPEHTVTEGFVDSEMLNQELAQASRIEAQKKKQNQINYYLEQ